jgi:putative nucleotidyltransferase with HDIG domain
MQQMKVLIVDSDQATLDNLKSNLLEQGDGWSFTFANSGRKALVAADMKSFDAIVASMEMPHMNGAQLLKKVLRRSPGSVRILISNGPSQELGLKSIGYAHQALSKGVSAEEICMVINRSFRLRDLFRNKDFHSQISQIKALPTPPPTYRQLVKEFQREEVDVRKIAEIISHDTALTAKLLQIINSAFFGLPTQVTNPLHAVTLLGLDTVQALALASGVFNRFDVKALGYISSEWLADHGIIVGQRARKIAEFLDLDPQVCENAALAGMLHDVGKLIELTYFRDDFKSAFDLARRDKELLYIAEKNLMGVSHAEMGAHLMSLWGMPYSVVEAIAFHHEPSRAGDPELSELTVVHLADALSWENTGVSQVPKGSKLDINYLTALGLTDRIDTIRELDAVPANS